MPQFRADILVVAAALIIPGCARVTATTPQPTTLPTSAPGTQGNTPSQTQRTTRSTIPHPLSAASITSLARLLQMEDARVLDTTLVRRLLADSSDIVRSRAARAAGRTGDLHANTLLQAATRDPDEQVAADAAFALGELGDTTRATLVALHTLLFRAGGGPAAREAANAMGKLVRTSAYASLQLGLRDAADVDSAGNGKTPSATPAPDVVPEMLLAIWHHPRQPHTVDVVLPFAQATDPATRFAATYALMRAGRPAAVPALLRALSDTDPLVRETAARGLRASLADSLLMRDAVRAALLHALADSAAHVRINAVRALGAFQDAALVEPVAALLHDPDGNVRTSAAAALGDLKQRAAAPALQAEATNPNEPLAIRAQALTSMVAIANDPNDPALGIAREWMRNPAWLQRIYGVRALAAASASIAAEPHSAAAMDLRTAVRDADPRVDAEALGDIAAADTADTTHALDALYLESLASADPVVRASAISALGRHRDTVYLSAILDAFARAQSDHENDAALAAVDALADFNRGDSAVARSFFLRFARSTDPVVRNRVAARFGTGAGTWGSPLPAIQRPIAYYENVVRTLVAPVLDGGPRPRVAIHSDSGDIVIALASDEAPLTVNNFFTLIDRGYFTSNAFRWHRVVPNFVLQDGDPRGDGSGGPGYAIRDEINRLRYTRGALGMALSGPDTGGSQFFITHSPQPHLDGGYTVFGYVVNGMDVADRVVQDAPIHGIDRIR